MLEKMTKKQKTNMGICFLLTFGTFMSQQVFAATNARNKKVPKYMRKMPKACKSKEWDWLCGPT
jgi:hypothetical protein